LIGTSGYMSYDELTALQNSGNEIGSHGKTHITCVGRPESWLQTEYSESKLALQSHGLKVNNFAFPYGEADSLAKSIASQYYKSARLAYNYPYEMSKPYPFLLLAGAGETPDETLPCLKIMMDRLATTNQWAIIFFHDIAPNINSQPGTINTVDFTGFLDYVVTKGIQTLTVNEVLGNSTPAPTPTPTMSSSPTATPTPTGAMTAEQWTAFWGWLKTRQESPNWSNYLNGMLEEWRHIQ
jgi:peptidoglycan/xylan/chitin deacetylase (PgdA/CDA1 family)